MKELLGIGLFIFVLFVVHMTVAASLQAIPAAVVMWTCILLIAGAIFGGPRDD